MARHAGQARARHLLQRGGYHRRLERIARAEGIDLGTLDDLIILNKAGKKVTLVSKGMNAELSPTMLWRDLEQLTRLICPASVVIDNSGLTFGGNEIDRAEVA